MRLIRICLLLVLPSMMGSAILAAMQTEPVASQEPQAKAGTRSSEPYGNMVAKHPARSRARKAVTRKGKKRPEYRPAFSEHSVEVINGDATNKVVFHDEQVTATAKNLPAVLKSAPAPMKVEVVNGAYTDTQYLYNNGEDQRIEAALNRPVVISVQSSDTRIAGGNKHPVVMRVTASGAGDAKSASEGGQPVTKSISPRPKRPPYQPDQH